MSRKRRFPSDAMLEKEGDYIAARGDSLQLVKDSQSQFITNDESCFLGISYFNSPSCLAPLNRRLVRLHVGATRKILVYAPLKLPSVEWIASHDALGGSRFLYAEHGFAILKSLLMTRFPLKNARGSSRMLVTLVSTSERLRCSFSPWSDVVYDLLSRICSAIFPVNLSIFCTSGAATLSQSISTQSAVPRGPQISRLLAAPSPSIAYLMLFFRLQPRQATLHGCDAEAAGSRRD
jgi:hypothetical protein